MRDLQWAELVEKTKQGDKEAFETLYNETKRSVYFTALKLLANEENAKDVLQDTYIAAIENLDKLSDAEKFPKWINTIAVNKCRRYFRAHPEDSLEERSEQGLDIRDDDEDLIPGSYVDDEVKRKVTMDIIMNELSEVQRQTIIMYYYNEMSLEEIAEIMDCPVKTVSSRLCSAREKIRKAVITYEKKNADRLHAIMPVSILTLILRKEAESIGVPDISLLFFTKTLIDAAAKASTGSAKAAVAAAKASAGTLKTVAAAGGKAAVASTLKVKILAGVLAVTAVGGGATAVIVHNADKEDKKVEETTTAIYEVIDEEGSYSSVDPTAQGITESETELELTDMTIPPDEELTPEAEAIIAKARESSEPTEFKFATKDGYKYIDPNEGEITLMIHGRFFLFEEESGNITGNQAKDKWMKYIPEVLESLSAQKVSYFQLPGMNWYISEQIIAKAANRDGIYMDKILIVSIYSPDMEGKEPPKTDETDPVSDEPYELPVTKMSQEMNDKLMAARDSETPVKVKFGTYNPIPFVDSTTGEKVDVRINGTFDYYQEASGIDSDRAALEAIVLLGPVLSDISGHYSFEDLITMRGYIAERIKVTLANEKGILIDNVDIASITKSE